VSEALQTLDQVSLQPLCVESVKVIAPQIASPENRDLRQLLWHRHRLVQMQTRIMKCPLSAQNHRSGGTQPRCLPRCFCELAMFDALLDIHVRCVDEPT
jgi:hypothetical protein